MKNPIAALVLSLICLSAEAGDVEIVGAKATALGGDHFRFDVTLRHADRGWDHYANRWRVLSLDGQTTYGTRTLHHPHVNEQPFTRSLSGVAIPAGVDTVLITARDSVHGVTENGFELKLPR
ncbi:MAG: hypothetical protein ACPG4N_04185 [Gammaproteobacteria bacterium]